jgi:transposase InsO family protein
MHHSDRGVQPCGRRLRRTFARTQNPDQLSRTGNPYDNAKGERFSRTLKYEEV